ncbi:MULTISPECIES: sensor domain-containing protein [unclassified Mycolicibacterium]|uniref:sensor domain-containing protein n=1 Tax=unclassified Mycolicibacterium TaxID=2636767 RepID=UPI0013082069|nr:MULTISPECIES: sensor domain-containing protein [unclassified Mycolicibacterium]MUL83476.1 sensor domain-containing protein [Mycolicibacterium sp. CBMA 329]MUL90467.1 sensor domain-containing protein [Mycolicibacterium sp. CBMA 331]MUM00439.1 sensor domain-containing protein [Mycolicibacterium sp. CBMA 334]MUM28734.1 sensor domain-containing protein [Mycolicibacterium sp. CBMA 295]MUM41411.1 sensor domain-containing protein [Mycolicibacterium sp. CBMA 247]
MIRLAISLVMLVLLATSCAGNGDKAQGPPKDVPKSALEGLLLSTDQVNTLMGTDGMAPHPAVTEMSDHRNLLPNLNCLGAWQVDESAIYGDHWTAMRQVLLRAPDNDDWDNLLVQSVVIFPSAQDADDFLNQSADRWSKCTNHHVNITLNGEPLPRWTSGDLTKTDSELTLPFTRVNGDQTRACQRALAVAANLVMDVQACKPEGSSVTQAADVVDEIKAAMPR